MRSKDTWSKISLSLREFRAASGARLVRDLNPPAIAKWLSATADRRSPATVNSLLRSLRVAVSYAMGQGWLKHDPFQFRSPAQWLPETISYESKVETHVCIDRLRALILRADSLSRSPLWTEARLGTLILTYVFTGIRKNEGLGLRVADFDLDTGFLTLRSNQRRRLKTRASAARLALPAPLATAVSAWLPRVGCEWAFPGVRRVGPWLDGQAGEKALDQIKRVGLVVGIPNLTIASFRHTLATLSEGWGVGELELQRWLRHTRAKTQRSYRHQDNDTLRLIAGKIDSGLRVG